MNDYSITDFKNVIVLRNQLETLSESELIDIYNDSFYYLTFLDTVAVLANVDSAFLLFNSEFINKIERVISLHRFDVPTDVKETINDIITYLNEIKAISSKKKELLKKSYLAYQEDIRKRKFKSDAELLYFQSYDAQVLYGLEVGSLDFLTDDSRFLSSTNYLIESIPELVCDIDTVSLLLEHMQEMECRKNFFQRKSKKSIHETRKRLIKKPKKEE